MAKTEIYSMVDCRRERLSGKNDGNVLVGLTDCIECKYFLRLDGDTHFVNCSYEDAQ